jgi:hypothetical protein
MSDETCYRLSLVVSTRAGARARMRHRCGYEDLQGPSTVIIGRKRENVRHGPNKC